MTAMPTAAELTELVARLGGDLTTATDAERVDLLRTLEEIKGAAAAAQARITVEFDASQRAEQASAGLRADQQGRGIAAQVALARRESVHRGGRLLGFAKTLVQDMPHTLRALSAGAISEWRATLVVRQAVVLSPEHRAVLDVAIAPKLGVLGDRGVAGEARRIADKLDPEAAVRRSRKAAADRHVSLRPAPDTMTYLTGLLPVAQGVAVFAALCRHADSLRSGGDPRSRGQIMADTLVERVTGTTQATAVSAEIQLVMTDRTLLDGDPAPAHLTGYGAVPAALARDLVSAAAQLAKVWVRRLYLSPGGGDLVAMDSRRRTFPQALRSFVIARDQVCRTPWCEAPIRHVDHVVRAADGGATSAANAQGLCEACNQAKEAPGWTASAGPPGAFRSPVTVTTPTRHRYTSTAPDPPGQGCQPHPDSPLEQALTALVAAA